MANIAKAPFSSIVFISRTLILGNAKATERFIGPLEEVDSPGGGSGGSGSGDPGPTPTIPTEGIIWWPKR